ncbi:GNAT family N-acetyltransferase [Clostridium vincentii]|uniref:N-acyltransferase YncA n=1 Tax=Clostridium vincentii TaxID=52704 RepID=A0A2T0BGT6_9CLOT|nr:GNAT family N-acetyltransferase [Clostridium vincentii]PRR83121.1 N-acyltransferase YncA [Clostridium vincentii]
MIRNVRIEDAKEIVDIYNYYILNSNVTFEIDSIDLEEMEKRIMENIKSNPWIVYEENNKILGYAYVGEWKSRVAFRFAKEMSVYLDVNLRGRGIGTKLMEKLLAECKKCDIHTLISIITMPNDTSLALHKKFGFEKAGYFKEVGFKGEKWLDVIYLQLLM